MTDCEDALNVLVDVINKVDRKLSSSDVAELKSLGLISVTSGGSSTATMNPLRSQPFGKRIGPER